MVVRVTAESTVIPGWSLGPTPWGVRIGALGTGFASGLLGQIVAHAFLVPPAEITSIWVPGGLILAFLVCIQVRLWPLLLGGFVVGGVCAFVLRSGMVLIPVLGYAWISACIAVGAWLVKLAPGQSSIFPTIGHLVRFFLYVVVGVSCACASGFVGVVALIRDDISLPRLWMLSTTAFAVGFMLVTPLVVDLQRATIPPWRDLAKQLKGFLVFCIGLWGLSILAWHSVPSNLSSIPLVLLAPIPLLMIAAFHFGRFGPSIGLIVAFLPAMIMAIRLDTVDTFELGVVNSHTMQLWTLAAAVLVHALAIQARQRNDILQRLLVSREENRSLAARLMQSQEEQSIRISRELHDSVNQKLTFFSIALSALKQRSPADLQDPIDEVTTGIRGLIDEVRDISHSLHPAVLEHAGIVGALDELVRIIKGRWGGEISLGIDTDPAMESLKGERALCIYRVAQESISNAIQHSGASTMTILLSASRGRWHLQVSDNGRGFTPGAAGTATGLGLVSMKERVALVGGTLSIHSLPGKGTTIAAELSV